MQASMNPASGVSQPDIFVVEDDENTLFLLRHMLERCGYVVRVASDGHDAEYMIATETAPTLITLDAMLPKVDGFQLISRIRNQPGWESVPIIMLTANSLEIDVVRALEAGADDYVVKPFRVNELLARIKRLLKGK